MLGRSITYIHVLFVAALAGTVGLCGYSYSLYTSSRGVDVEKINAKAIEYGQKIDLIKNALKHEAKNPIHYSIVVDNNLFNETRKEYEPPAPKPKPKPKPKSKMVFKISNKDIVYHAGMSVNGQYSALVEFKRLNAEKKKLYVKVGEKVQDEKFETMYYLVNNITRDEITIEDSAGTEYVINIADNKRGGPQRMTAATAPQQQITTVTTETKAAETSIVAGGSSSSKKSGSSGGGSAGNIAGMSSQEKEEMVKSGQLEKIITPFGPSYRVKK